MGVDVRDGFENLLYDLRCEVVGFNLLPVVKQHLRFDLTTIFAKQIYHLPIIISCRIRKFVFAPHVDA
jgi:hypothetical protein